VRTLASILVVMLIIILVLSPSSAWAFGADEALQDPGLEARALTIHDELRCPVCQGQAISDSNAELARDLRRIVRERIAAGDSDGAVFDYLTDRYGDFILLRPPVKPTNYVLWFGPAAVFVVGTAGLIIFITRRRKQRRDILPTPLTYEEQQELKKIRRDDPS